MKEKKYNMFYVRDWSNPSFNLQPWSRRPVPSSNMWISEVKKNNHKCSLEFEFSFRETLEWTKNIYLGILFKKNWNQYDPVAVLQTVTCVLQQRENIGFLPVNLASLVQWWRHHIAWSQCWYRASWYCFRKCEPQKQTKQAAETGVYRSLSYSFGDAVQWIFFNQ